MRCCRHCAEILRRLEALERRRGPRDAADEAVLAALARLGRPFTARAAFRHAGLVDEALAAALEAADLSSPRELGWMLQRCEGADAAFRVERVRESRDGIEWRVLRV
jgi:hypothetical protein